MHSHTGLLACLWCVNWLISWTAPWLLWCSGSFLPMYNHGRFAGMLIQLLKILKFWTMTNRVIVLQYRMAAFSCPPLQHPLGKLHFSFLRKFRYWVTIWSSWRAEQTHQLVDYTPGAQAGQRRHFMNSAVSQQRSHSICTLVGSTAWKNSVVGNARHTVR